MLQQFGQFGQNGFFNLLLHQLNFLSDFFFLCYWELDLDGVQPKFQGAHELRSQKSTIGYINTTWNSC